MNGYEQFIALALATALGIFLLLSIVVLVLVIKVMNRVKHIAEKAESIADKAEYVGDFFKNASGPFLIAKILANMRHIVGKHGKSTKRSK